MNLLTYGYFYFVFLSRRNLVKKVGKRLGDSEGPVPVPCPGPGPVPCPGPVPYRHLCRIDVDIDINDDVNIDVDVDIDVVIDVQISHGIGMAVAHTNHVEPVKFAKGWRRPMKFGLCEVKKR